jgi:hypothetical protein
MAEGAAPSAGILGSGRCNAAQPGGHTAATDCAVSPASRSLPPGCEHGEPAGDGPPPPDFNTPQADCNTALADCNTMLASCNIDFANCNAPLVSCNVALPNCNTQLACCNMPLPSGEMPLASGALQSASGMLQSGKSALQSVASAPESGGRAPQLASATPQLANAAARRQASGSQLGSGVLPATGGTLELETSAPQRFRPRRPRLPPPPPRPAGRFPSGRDGPMIGAMRLRSAGSRVSSLVIALAFLSATAFRPPACTPETCPWHLHVQAAWTCCENDCCQPLGVGLPDTALDRTYRADPPAPAFTLASVAAPPAPSFEPAAARPTPTPPPRTTGPPLFVKHAAFLI